MQEEAPDSTCLSLKDQECSSAVCSLHLRVVQAAPAPRQAAGEYLVGKLQLPQGLYPREGWPSVILPPREGTPLCNLRITRAPGVLARREEVAHEGHVPLHIREARGLEQLSLAKLYSSPS